MKRQKILLGIGLLMAFIAISQFSMIFDKNLDWEQDGNPVFGTFVFLILTAVFLFLSREYISSKLLASKKNMKLANFQIKNKHSNFFAKFCNSIKEKRSKQIENRRTLENNVKNQFQSLDILTVNAIAGMLGQTNSKYRSASIFSEDIKEVDIGKVILDFCMDSYNVADEYELNSLYTKEYYRGKIAKHLSPICEKVRDRIISTIPSNKRASATQYYNDVINLICDGMVRLDGVKFMSVIMEEHKEESQPMMSYGLERIDYRYRDSLIYMVDVVLTCVSIAKILFIERKIKELDNRSKFYITVSNMAKEFNNHGVIVEKIRPIYDEFYKSEFGFIDDDLLFNIGIAIMANRTRMKQSTKPKQESGLLEIYKERHSIDSTMLLWLNEMAKLKKSDEIRISILNKVISIVGDDFDLLMTNLGNVDYWTDYYYKRASHNKKVSDRDRYLTGDFEKEKREMGEQYSLNNITTGTQFELYLENLFKNLGYKVKHNGKAGDQGADLILKKEDYVYVVQAKYYNSPLGNTPIQEIVGSLKYYNANQGVVVTNSTFTRGAVLLAKANNVVLVDGKDLKKLVDYIFSDEQLNDVLQNF